jgi:GntR family transcriptional regulator/MocR family aminotransferase
MLAATRGLATAWDDVVVTSGSQMALDLVGRAVLRQGDVVAVEQIGYRPAWLAFQQHGAKLVPIPVDAGGLNVDALAALVRTTPIRAVYVTPHHQYPTTVTLSAGRRIALLELAKRFRFAVIEDDYDHEFHYEGRPVLPLASADVHGVVVYLGTLSKVLAPGLRIGFIVAPEPLATRLAAVRRVVDRQGDHLLENAVAELLEEGEIQRHIRRAKRIYAERRERLAALLQSRLGSALSFRLPSGLVLQPARLFAFDGKSRPFLRIGFAQHEEREVREAIRRMEAALLGARKVSARSTAGSARASRALRSSP